MIIVLLLLFIVVILWLGAASAGINSLTGGINGLTRSLKKKTMKEDLLKARAEAQALREALAQAQGQGQPLAKSNTPIPKAGSLAPQHEPPPPVAKPPKQEKPPVAGLGKPASYLIYTIVGLLLFIGMPHPFIFVVGLILLVGTLVKNNPGKSAVIARKAIGISFLPALICICGLFGPPTNAATPAPYPSPYPAATHTPAPAVTPSSSASPSPLDSPEATPTPQAETPFRKAILREANHLFKREPGKGWELKPPFESRVHTDEPAYIIIECFLDEELVPATPVRDMQDLPTDEQVYNYACQIAKRIAQSVVKFNQDNHIPIDDDIVVDVNIMKETKVFGVTTGDVTGSKNLSEAKYLYKKKKFVIIEPDQN